MRRTMAAGFTLIELLASVMLLGVLAVGVLSWVVVQRRAAAAAEGQAARSIAITETVRLLRDDLDGGVLLGGPPGVSSEVTLVTLHAPAGDRRGVQRVTWSMQADGRVLRTTRPTVSSLSTSVVILSAGGQVRGGGVVSRVVTTQAQGWSFDRDPSVGLQVAIPRSGGQPLRIPIQLPATGATP